jgi:hypothetical protein
MHPFQIVLVRGAVLAGMMLSSNFGFGQHANKIYRCIAKDAIRLQDDGGLGGRELSRKTHAFFFSPFMIDTLTGAISYSVGTRLIWRIIQKGDDKNDHVLTPPSPVYGEPETILASAATDFIRVRDWARSC